MAKGGTKNPSGGWLRYVLMQRWVATTAVTMGVMGFLLGVLVRGMPPMDHVLRYFSWWTVSMFVALMFVATIITSFWYLRRMEATWGRGWAAERRVGDRIEHALARPGCAYAHDVKEALGSGGNVDHVALTPAGLWVVETKSTWLESGFFQKALGQAARNAERVRRHLATRIPVRAALVIADESEQPYESERDWQGEPVTVFRMVSFWERLREECETVDAGGAEERTSVSRRVWDLGSSRYLSP